MHKNLYIKPFSLIKFSPIDYRMFPRNSRVQYLVSVFRHSMDFKPLLLRAGWGWENYRVLVLGVPPSNIKIDVRLDTSRTDNSRWVLMRGSALPPCCGKVAAAAAFPGTFRSSSFIAKFD